MKEQSNKTLSTLPNFYLFYFLFGNVETNILLCVFKNIKNYGHYENDNP